MRVIINGRKLCTRTNKNNPKVLINLFFKVQYGSMITYEMENRMFYSRKQSPNAQTRLKRLRTILP